MSEALSDLPFWSHGLHALVIAILDLDGNIIEANDGFRDALPEKKASNAADWVLEPAFFRWIQFSAIAQDAVYDGLIRIGAGQGRQRIVAGKIYKRGQHYLLVGELDISSFEKLSQELESANRELEEVRRQVTRRNQALQKAYEDLQEARQQDLLTGLSLKTKLFQQIDEEILRWERYRRPLALIVMDMDHFSEINDHYGREVGDELLKHVATLARQSIRSLDVAARYGGQEFAILLPETNEMGALIVAERLRMELESQIILPLVKPMSASFGVAMLLEGEQRKDFCARAERAQRHSKNSGRNCVTMAGVIADCDYVYQGTVKKVEGSGSV